MAQPTRFYGSSRPLDVFHDDVFFENEAPMTSHAPMPNPTRPIRRPLSNSTSNVILEPASSSHNSKFSPYKVKSTSPRAPLKPSHGLNKLNAISMAPPTDKAPVTDSLQKKPQLSNFKTGLQKPPLADPNAFFGKENVHPQIFPAPPTINLSVEQYYQNPTGKRGLMEAAPIKESRVSKKPKADEQSLPPHDSFPPITDDGTKPPHSYAQLIGMAILRSSKRRLTLAQIYKWISDNYSFYNPNDAGWQNSIRHNLSLHKNFIKIERPKDDPGKGNYWGIEPGTEFQFLKEKPTRKSVPTAENLPVMSTRLEPSRPTPALMPEPSLPPPAPIHHHHQHHQHANSLPPLPTSQATLSMPLEPSSDATILVSDNAPAEDLVDKGPDNELPLESSFFSPLPAALHSTPPFPRPERRNGTPPPMSRNPASSVTRTHKRKFASMDDSGYISSLESSAMRPNAARSAFFTSESDRHRIKRGRAEEEIARLRGSSPFSPTKSRSFAGYGLTSSSPFRQSNENQMPPPLTPVVKKVKAIIQPPPSVSPNTNLRIHRAKVRHMLQSPLRRVANLTNDDNLPWSPAFRLDDNLFSFDTPNASNIPDFDIFQDLPVDDENVFDSIGSADAGSPIKRSVKRARLDRSISSSAIGEMSASKKLITSAPLLKAPDTPSQFLETPSKVFEGLSSPSKLFQESPIRGGSPSKFASLIELPGDGDWPSLHIDASDFASGADASDFTGLDILQGFEKIGSGSQPSRGLNKSGKPALGRSFSTTF
ncbi:forkhead transcription factor [Trichoderma arundinaceum]|uniref:Forkhead transcription factor n=1 Tax=Trichoderma arundinaceum TaxID=490622 RepID=A0A395NNZ9_TRIAR|nr:forkhead transcription factor [Trichoderma arundinaceum]